MSGVDGARESTRAPRVKRGELTIPKRFSTLRVSMVCNVGISTRSSECSGLKGMVVGVKVSLCAVCGERDGCWCTLMDGVWVGMRVGWYCCG